MSNPDIVCLVVHGRYSDHEIEQRVEQLREQLLTAAESADKDQEM